MAAKKSTKKTQDTLMDKVVMLGSSLAYLTKGATDELIDVLEKNKVISTKDGKETVEKVKSELQKRQDKVRQRVTSELEKVIDQLGIATKKDLEALKKKPARSTNSAKAKKTTKSSSTK